MLLVSLPLLTIERYDVRTPIVGESRESDDEIVEEEGGVPSDIENASDSAVEAIPVRPSSSRTC